MTQKFTIGICMLVFSVLSMPLTGQITVGESTLPDIGDVLEYSFFGYDETTTYREDGENLSWTYSIATIDSTRQEAYLDIDGTPAQDSFPTANMLITGIGIDAAAIRTSNDISIVGFAGGPADIIDLGVIRFNDPLLVREVPIDYGDRLADSVQYSFTVSSSLIPGLDTIMLMGATIDSLRFTFKLVMESEATAWGKLNVNGNSMDVLKMTIEETTVNGLELGVNFGGNILWIDGSLLFGDAFGGRELSTSYVFLSADSKASILEFEEQEVPIDTMGNTETVVTGRMRSDLVTSVGDLQEITGLELSPNPAHSQIQVLSDETLIDASYRILSLDGRVVQSTKSITEDLIDIRHLSSGVYLLEVRSQDKMGVVRLVKD